MVTHGHAEMFDRVVAKLCPDAFDEMRCFRINRFKPHIGAAFFHHGIQVWLDRTEFLGDKDGGHQHVAVVICPVIGLRQIQKPVQLLRLQIFVIIQRMIDKSECCFENRIENRLVLHAAPDGLTRV